MMSHTGLLCEAAVVWYVAIVYIPTSFCLTINASRTPSGTLVIGNYVFSLTCAINSEGADVFGTELARKREIDSDYLIIVSFPPPTVNRNVSYIDTSLESRTTAVKPVTGSMAASLTFKDVVCTDKASYRWTVNFYDTQQRNLSAITEIDSLKALSQFRDDGQVSYSPSSNLQEGDNVVFSCQGNVGSMPIGVLVWFLYRNGATSGGEIQTQGVTTNQPTAESGNPCSYRRSSTLRLNVTQDLDGAVVRCTTQQDVRDERGDNGDNFKQTEALTVLCPPKVRVDRNPPSDQDSYEEGTAQLTLNCSTLSMSASTYYWTVFNPQTGASASRVMGPVVQLVNLQINDTGSYTCIVQNTVNGRNCTANTTVNIIVFRRSGITITSSPAANGSYLSVQERQPVTIHCTSHGGHPAPDVTLHSGGTHGPVLPGFSSASQESGGTYRVTLTATFAPTRQDDRQVLMCLAYWPSLADAQYLKQSAIVLYVEFPPDTVSPPKGHIWAAVAAGIVAVIVIVVLVVLNRVARRRASQSHGLEGKQLID